MSGVVQRPASMWRRLGASYTCDRPKRQQRVQTHWFQIGALWYPRWTGRFRKARFVYWAEVECPGGEKFIKIGLTTDVEKRLVSLQAGMPIPVRLLCVVPGDETREAAALLACMRHHVRGEWFEAHPDVYATIPEEE